MAEENGNGSGGLPSLPNEVATFHIGGRDIQVPALTLWDLEQSKDDIRALNPEMVWSAYAAAVIRIVARKLKPETAEPYAEALQKACTVPEARNIYLSFFDLWRISGFDLGEAEAAQEEVSPGIGTSTESPPNSPSPSVN